MHFKQQQQGSQQQHSTTSGSSAATAGQAAAKQQRGCCHSWVAVQPQGPAAAARCGAMLPAAQAQLLNKTVNKIRSSNSCSPARSPCPSGRRPGRTGRSGPQSRPPPCRRSWSRRPRGRRRAGPGLRHRASQRSQVSGARHAGPAVPQRSGAGQVNACGSGTVTLGTTCCCRLCRSTLHAPQQSVPPPHTRATATSQTSNTNAPASSAASRM